MGEMAQLLVEGQPGAPQRLLRAGFEFRRFTLASALRDLIPDQHAPPRLRAADRDCEVWFNGDCPVCSYEIGAYEKLAERRDLPLRFHDSMRVAQPLSRLRTAPGASGTQAVPARRAGPHRQRIRRRARDLGASARIPPPGQRVFLAAVARGLRNALRPLHRTGARVLGASPTIRSQAIERIFRPHYRHRDFTRAQQRHGVRHLSPAAPAARGRLPARLYSGVLDSRCGDGDLPVAAWVVLVWGMPSSPMLDVVSAGEIARRALAATSFALVGIVIATGLRLSSLRAPSSYDNPRPVR